MGKGKGKGKGGRGEVTTEEEGWEGALTRLCCFFAYTYLKSGHDITTLRPRPFDERVTLHQLFLGLPGGFGGFGGFLTERKGGGEGASGRVSGCGGQRGGRGVE
jgi:hypothetical protein